MEVTKLTFDGQAKPSSQQYKFPICITESTYFSASGGWIEEAKLYCASRLLGVIRKDYPDADFENDEPPEIQLPFIDAPLHGALITQPISIQLKCIGNKMPSIIMRPAEKNISLTDIVMPYTESVLASADKGIRQLTISYGAEVGYLP